MRRSLPVCAHGADVLLIVSETHRCISSLFLICSLFGRWYSSFTSSACQLLQIRAAAAVLMDISRVGCSVRDICIIFYLHFLVANGRINIRARARLLHIRGAFTILLQLSTFYQAAVCTHTEGSCRIRGIFHNGLGTK
jgi:hypothetical protein